MILKLTENYFYFWSNNIPAGIFFFYYNIHVPVVRNVTCLKNLKIKKNFKRYFIVSLNSLIFPDVCIVCLKLIF